MTAVFAPARRTRRRLLTVGHSYVLRSNRRLAEAIADAANGEWDVTVAAPEFYQGHPRYGDLKPERLDVGADERVRVEPIPVAFSNRVHVALYGRRLRELMASGFDAIHCWEEPYIVSGAQFAQWAPRDAVLTYFSWQNISKRYPPPFNWLERRSIGRSDGWIAGGKLSEDVLRDRAGYRDKPYRVIGFGVDPAQFRPDPIARALTRAALGWDDEDIPVVGYVGRLTEAKGVRLLMRTLAAIDRPWRALFVGSGELEAELRAWSTRYGERVAVVSTVTNAEIPNYLNVADVVCVPSQTTPIWREQFGRVLIEAFACGACVVASDSGEIPYVVGDAGRIVGERDEAGWRRELDGLLAEPSRRAALAARGRRRVDERYTWSAIGSRYVEFFDELTHAQSHLRDGRRR